MTVCTASRATRLLLLVTLLSLLAGLTAAPRPGLPDGAHAAPAWNGVPHVAVEHERDVESWWADHPFNPESPRYAPDIASPSPQVNVRTQHGGNIQAAIDALPAAGGTLYFPAGTYTGNFRLVGKSNVHFRGEPGAVIVGTGQNRIAGCELADSYSTFGAYIQARVPEALHCATDGRIRNIYIKGLVFDGGGTATEAFDLSAAMDIVFDNLTFQNFRDPGSGHPGIISGNAVLDGIWVRNSRFVGREQYAVYFDGLHGGGVINSTIENGFSRSALLFLTNDDFSRDYNGDGRITLPEHRMSQQIVVYGNTFAGGTYDLVSATTRNLLMMANSISVPVVTVAYFQSKSSAVDPQIVYEFTGNRLVRNSFRTVHQFIEIAGPPQCPKVVNCARVGQYQIRDNVVESAANYVRPATHHNSQYGSISGPNVVSGNCIADPSCRGIAGGGPTQTPTPSGGGGATIAQRFPLGIFEDANITNGLDARFEPMIRDAQAKNLDSVLFNNNNVDRDEPMLSVSDRLGFNVYFAPHHELNAQWFYGSAPATIEAARALAYPIVDRVKAHPSLRGYNLVDEPNLQLRDKLTLMVRAFRERDPARPATPILIGINTAEPLFAAAQPGVFLADVYSLGTPNPPCTYTMTGFGYQQEDFSSYVRRITAQKPPDVPLWLILQTHRYSQGSSYALRAPSVPELRAQQWMAVGEGATGLFWFTYSTQQDWIGLKDAPALFSEIGELARRLGPLRAPLVNARRVANIMTVSGPNTPYVSTLATTDGQRRFAVVVNRGTCSGSAALTLSSSSFSGRLRDLETGAIYALGTPITFAAGDGKVFELLADGAATPTATAAGPTATPTRTPGATAAGPTATPTRTPGATATPTAQAGATATPTAQAGGNLVANSSFDTLSNGYPTSWRQRPTATYDGGISRSGRGSLRLVGPVASTYADQPLTLRPSTTYVLRFWTRTLNVSGAGVAVRYAQTAPVTQTLVQSGYTAGTREWKQEALTFTTPPNHAGGRIDIQWSINSGTAWVDDVVLEPLTIPSSPSANRVANGTFEASVNGFPTSWRPRPNAVWTTNVFRSGAASFELRGPSPDTYSDQAVQLRPGTRYALTYWIRTMNATGPGVSVRYSQLQPDARTLVLSPALSGSRAWTQVTVHFETPANYVSGRLDIRWELGGGYAWIDDMLLFEDPAP